jgi:hypothetical protein
MSANEIDKNFINNTIIGNLAAIIILLDEHKDYFENKHFLHALKISIMYDNFVLAKFFIEKACGPYIQPENNLGTKFTIIKNGETIIKYFAQMLKNDFKIRSITKRAIIKNRLDIVYYFLFFDNYDEEHCKVALATSIEHGHISLVKHLIEDRGLDPFPHMEQVRPCIEWGHLSMLQYLTTRGLTYPNKFLFLGLRNAYSPQIARYMLWLYSKRDQYRFSQQIKGSSIISIQDERLVRFIGEKLCLDQTLRKNKYNIFKMIYKPASLHMLLSFV